MAIYKGTALVSRITGKLGTEDFMTWKNKLVVRKSPTTVTDPNSPLQAAIRQSMIDNGNVWSNTLTGPEKAQWESFALSKVYKEIVSSGERNLVAGNGGIYTGYNAFIMLNQFLASVESTPITVPPIAQSAQAPAKSLRYTWNDITSRIEIDWGVSPDFDDTEFIRFWIHSVQNFFHKQIAGFTSYAAFQFSIGTVRSALGLNLDLIACVPSTVFICSDIVHPDGRRSKQTSTFALDLIAPHP